MVLHNPQRRHHVCSIQFLRQHVGGSSINNDGHTSDQEAVNAQLYSHAKIELHNYDEK